MNFLDLVYIVLPPGLALAIATYIVWTGNRSTAALDAEIAAYRARKRAERETAAVAEAEAKAVERARVAEVKARRLLRIKARRDALARGWRRKRMPAYLFPVELPERNPARSPIRH